MLTMIEDYFGPDNAAYVIWAGLALAAILVALLVYLLLRRAFGGTYVAGGRNRRPRLAVLDAAAVDARRRLVLVRRDETEHLILIGGPTDVVVESGIRPGGMPAPRPAGTAQPAMQPRRPAAPPPPPAQTAPQPRPTPPQARMPELPAAPPVRPAIEAPPRPQPPERTIIAPPPPTETPPPAAIEPAPEPASPFRRFFAPKPAASPAVAQPVPASPATSEADISLEDEMSRLLDELTDGKK